MQNWKTAKTDDASNFGCVVFDAETDNASSVLANSNRLYHQALDNLSEDSCHGNIRYSAVEGLVQNTRPQQYGTVNRRSSKQVKDKIGNDNFLIYITILFRS